jgi:hypothetical protein
VVMRQSYLVLTNCFHCDRCTGCPCAYWWLTSESLCALACEICYLFSFCTDTVHSEIILMKGIVFKKYGVSCQNMFVHP